MNRPFEGKTALITGAGQGIGRAIALRLALDGAAVAVADLAPDHARAVAAEVATAGGRAVAIEADVSDLTSIDEMVRRTVAEFEQIDIVVCNAGLIKPNPFGSVTEQDWDVSFDVNAKGTFFTMQAAAPHVPDGGAIVTIASVAGRGTATGSPPYAASKAAVINVTQTTARALGPRRIRVNAVCPGFVETEFQRRLDEEIGQRRQGLPEGELARRWAAANLLGRTGRAEEIAAAVAYLAGPEAGLITGQTLNLDGGVVIY